MKLRSTKWKSHVGLLLMALAMCAIDCKAQEEEVVGRKEADTQALKGMIDDLKVQFVPIPICDFQMGSIDGEEDERPVHTVEISRPFEMSKYEVTQAQWEAVMGSNPSRFQGPNLPVEQVNWETAQVFIHKLNEIQTEYLYRLPTEAEWEYAARACTSGAYAGDLDAMAWYGSNSGRQKLNAKLIWDTNRVDYVEKLTTINGCQTHPVGQKQPNAWGLYDMHGNVWEWVQDWYDKDYYAHSPTVDPQGPPSGTRRVLRGGSWFFVEEFCRSAARGATAPNFCNAFHGLRLARTRRGR